MLAGKKVLLGITGSISAYKSLQIVRDLTQAGAQVQVVLTKAAERFVPFLTLQIFSGRPVLRDLSEANQEMAHVTLAGESDLVLIAPITAHFISKMAMGLNDDLLSSLILSTSSPVVIVPAMDIGMWEHPAVQANVDRLRRRGVQIIGPETGLLASGKVGLGRFSDEKKIVTQVISLLSEDHPSLLGEVVLITAGPTEEAIDPVRYISNRSSGKMGYALAEIAQKWGARVILISGPTSIPVPEGLSTISVNTADEMKKAVDQYLPGASIVIMAAAVSDYRPKIVSSKKIKKSGANQSIELEETADILAERPNGKPGQVVIGFAAETEDLIQNARKKLKKKRLDLIVANDVTAEGAGFDVDTNRVQLIPAHGKTISCPKMSKHRISVCILKEVLRIKAEAC